MQIDGKATSELELGEYLDLSRQRVNELVHRGVLPRKGPDGWDLQECLRKYLNHLRRGILERRFTPAQIDALQVAGLLNPEIVE